MPVHGRGLEPQQLLLRAGKSPAVCTLVPLSSGSKILPLQGTFVSSSECTTLGATLDERTCLQFDTEQPECIQWLVHHSSTAARTNCTLHQTQRPRRVWLVATRRIPARGALRVDNSVRWLNAPVAQMKQSRCAPITHQQHDNAELLAWLDDEIRTRESRK